MAFRAEKGVGAVLIAVAFSPALFAQDFRYEAWHGHSRPPHIRRAGEFGTLRIDANGVSFQARYKGKPPKHPHDWHWNYDEIQQLNVWLDG